MFPVEQNQQSVGNRISFHVSDLHPSPNLLEQLQCIWSLLYEQGGGGGGEGVAECRTQGGEMLLTLPVGWQVSAMRSEEVGCFCEVAGVSMLL